jgi:hypothetical protein
MGYSPAQDDPACQKTFLRVNEIAVGPRPRQAWQVSRTPLRPTFGGQL